MNSTHVLAVFIGIVYPMYFLFSYRATTARLKADKKRRLRNYKLTMTVLWTLTLIIIGNSILNTSINLEFFPSINNTTIVFAIFIVIFILIQSKQSSVTPEKAPKIKEKMRGFEHYLPKSKNELTWFILLSLSAGICEEIIFRMFLFNYSLEHFHLITSLFLANFVFAITHIGSGSRNMLGSFLLGLLLNGIYYLTNNIWLAIILHSAIDINTGVVAYKVNRYVSQSS